MDAYEEAVTPYKLELLQNARKQEGGQQSVLEIGIGAAPNIQYLTRASLEQVEHSNNKLKMDSQSLAFQ